MQRSDMQLNVRSTIAAGRQACVVLESVGLTSSLQKLKNVHTTSTCAASAGSVPVNSEVLRTASRPRA